ncbi:MAG: hypothetical protein KKE44_07150 [Proteobacteria bacterium]|nr:hypothetical protein [Pseudomonadota bacterium]MBU1582506.1 hypothetical protein [Pseudomonadota bacterium]MBU2631846.1 hypothetical protein [Pseudomonadota bacterium]
MTKKKKVMLIVGVLLLVIVTSGFGFVMITGACGVDPVQGHRFSKRGLPPFMHKEIANFILWRMDQGLEPLNLSEVQQKRYEDFRSQLQKTMEMGMQTRQEFKKQTLLELEKQNPDLSTMAVNVQSHLANVSALLSENLTLFTHFYNALDSDQKTKITMKIKERLEAHKKYESCYDKEI